MRLASSDSAAYIEFFDVEADYFSVSMVAHNHSASRRVYTCTDGAALARLFAEAAEEWKGWDGARVWESIEGEFRLALTIDHFGHVTASVRLRSDSGGSECWQLDAKVALEAGQLNGIAKEAHRLWCSR